MSVSITASGLVTAVGFNAEATLAAIRGGISGLKPENIWDYESGEYIAGARVPLPQWWESVDKLADLLAPAVLACWQAAAPLQPEDIPVFIGLAGGDRPRRSPMLERQLLELLNQRLEDRLSRESRTIARPQVSAIVGVAAAERLFAEGRARACIIAGVDSFLDRLVAAEYFRRRRLLSPSNSNGFSPGEAGTAVLVQPTASAPAGSLEILGIGFGRETGPIESDEPLLGDGLTGAVRDALRAAGLRIVDAAYRITDLNGEQYKFKEAMIALTRNGPGAVWPRLFELWHPIEYVGEVGAAIGPLVLALALHAGRHDYAPGPVALCHFSSDDGERAAAVTRYNPARQS